MAFSEPAIHSVERIQAVVHSSPTWEHTALELRFTQGKRHGFDAKYPARLEIYSDTPMDSKLQALADAINAVFAAPVEQTEEV